LSESVESVEKLAETVEKLLMLKPEDRQALLNILRKYKPQQIMKALNDIVVYDRRGKRRVLMTLEEFEQHLRRVRF
jgi:ribosomal protein L4